MLNLLWLIPTLPLLGFLILAFSGPRLGRRGSAVVGVGSVGLSALVTLLVGGRFIANPPAGNVYTQTLWTWLDVAGFRPQIAFHLDALAVVMILVVTVVGFLIHLYSVEFMRDDAGYSRFFAYMNLFVSAMLILVLADNLLLLYLGWEGVGLCSYLLIGFWFNDPANGRAARKAFIVTRVGDTAMAIGLFLLFTQLGTLHIQNLMQQAEQTWPVGSAMAVAAALLLLGGAVGKSAQLPLQTWLPDAMAGPTPVSALIHAATMVTAGVYLIARTHVLFELAPGVLLLVAVIGALTLLLAGFSALVQTDIKRVLAYSTISQIGYMFLALGVGAWSAALFHFMTHAFFKALLFLAAGAVILAMHHEHNMFKMGGLRRHLPLTFWTFLIGAASLAAVPLVTAGFYSKDLILFDAWGAEGGNGWLWAAGWIGALITSLYTFRMVFVTFFGGANRPIGHRPGFSMRLPLIILAIFALLAGFVEMPETLGGISLFSNFTEPVLPKADIHAAHITEIVLQIVAAIAALGGIYLAYLFYLQRPTLVKRLNNTAWATALQRFWFAGWSFDWLYNRVFIQPYVWLARSNQADNLDLIPLALAWLSQRLHNWLSQTQTGRLRWYAAGIAGGAAITVAIILLG